MAQIKNVLFGKLAVSTRFITEEQLQECLDFQKEVEERGEKPPRLGEILEQKGYLTKQQIQSILETMSSMQRRRFGEIAVAFHFITLEQLETCLDIQKLLSAPQETVPLFGQALVTYRNFLKQVLAGGAPPKIGDVLCAMGYLRGHQVAAVLEEQNKRIVRCKSCEASLNISRFEPGQKIKCGQCNAVLEIVKPEGQEELDVALPAEETPPPAEGGLPEGEPQAMDPAMALQEVERELAARKATQELAAQKKMPGRLGDYQVVTRLGQDATGVIFKAIQTSKNRPVALKIMNPSVMNDKNFQKKFVDDAKKVAALDHPNIKKVFSLGKTDARFYIAMEFVEAESVYNVLEKQGKFHHETAVNIAISLVEALQYAHEQGLIHGDIRPSNILILRDGSVKLANLGLATKITENILAISRSGQMAPFYIAPECVTGDREMDHRTDVYSLGATLFHMIAGRPPFQGQSPFEVLVRLTEETIPPLKFFDPGIPDSICRIVEKMLEAEPQDRYQDYPALLTDLRAVAMAPAGASTMLKSGKHSPAGAAPAIKTPEEARREYESRAHRAIQMRRMRQSVAVGAVVAALAVGGWFLNRKLEDDARAASYQEIKSRYARSQSTPAAYDEARVKLTDFSKLHPATPEAADASDQVRILHSLEEVSRSDELEGLRKDIDERIGGGRFKEAYERLTTGSWWPSDGPEMRAKKDEIDVAAARHWDSVIVKAKALAEKRSYDMAALEVDNAVRARDLPGDAAKADELKKELASIKEKNDLADAEAKKAQLAAESKVKFDKLSEPVRSLKRKLDTVEANRLIRNAFVELVSEHQAECKEEMNRLDWIAELKTETYQDINFTSGGYTGDPKTDRRIKMKLSNGLMGAAIKADATTIEFSDGQNPAVPYTWATLPNATLFEAFDRVLQKKDLAKYQFAAGDLAILRAEQVEGIEKIRLMGRAGRYFGKAASGGLNAEAAAYQAQVKKWFDDTMADVFTAIRLAIQQKEFAEAKSRFRSLLNQREFESLLPAFSKDLDDLQRDMFTGAAGGDWTGFSQGVGSWKSGSGAAVSGGILTLSGKNETLEWTGQAEEIGFFFKLPEKSVRFTINFGAVEFLFNPDSDVFDLRVLSETGLLDRESAKDKLKGLTLNQWHYFEMKIGGVNGARKAEVFVNGDPVCSAALNGTRPVEPPKVVVQGKSSTAAGKVILDSLFVR